MLALACTLFALAGALPATASAQRIDLEIDHQAGTPESTALEATAGLETSTEGLTVEASPVRGGGVMVRLHGRFRSVDRIERDSPQGAQEADEREAP